MKILITGAAGLVGYRCTVLLNAHTVIPTSLTMPEYLPKHAVRLDITDRTRVVDVFKQTKPDVVIHCAANTDVDYCELHPEVAQRVNVEGTKNLVDAAQQIGAKFVYLSTDYVFDGTTGPYDEGAIPNPLSAYARSKFAGEQIVATLPGSLILRTSVVYGHNPVERNFATWLIGELRHGKPVRIVRDQYNNPTFADQLVEAITFLLAQDATGVWNIGDATYSSRYEFARMVAEVFELPPTLITPVDTKTFNQPAPRPLRCGLKLEKLQRAGFTLQDTRTCLNQLREQLAHPA